MTRLHQVSTTRSPVLPGELWGPGGKEATRRRRRRSPIFVALAIAALIVLPLLAYIATVSNAARIGYHILQLNRDIAVLESDHERLQAIASSLRSPDRLERVAESRLGLRPPGDQQIAAIVLPQTVSRHEAHRGLWQRLAEYLFQGEAQAAPATR
jgi:cell division protein FtsL